MSVWVHRVRTITTIVTVEVGELPSALTYIHCHREPRRQLLLRSRVEAEWTRPHMVHVVRTAMRLARNGSIPGVGDHGRTKDFLKRCSEALRAIEPSREADVAKLGAEEQQLIREAMGDKEALWEGCFGCLADKPTWLTTDLSSSAVDGARAQLLLSRCATCKFPKSFGRRVKRIGDILRRA